MGGDFYYTTYRLNDVTLGSIEGVAALSGIWVLHQVAIHYLSPLCHTGPLQVHHWSTFSQI